MLFELDKRLARITARDMAPRSLEQRQRDVYDSHRHRVFSVSFYMTGSELEAEEILQDTFVQAFGKADEPDHNLVDAALVEQIGERAPLDEKELPLPQIGFVPECGNILRTDLEEAIRCLPPLERLVFLLMDVEGYPDSRVAALLHKSPGEVRRAAMLARMRLRAELASLRADGEQAA